MPLRKTEKLGTVWGFLVQTLRFNSSSTQKCQEEDHMRLLNQLITDEIHQRQT